MDENANLMVNGVLAKHEEVTTFNEENKLESKETEDDKDTTLKTEQDDWHIWYFVGILSKQLESTLALIDVTFKLQPLFRVPSRTIWGRISQQKFFNIHPDVTYPIDMLVKKLRELKKTMSGEKAAMLQDCLTHLVCVRAVWIVKLKILRFTTDGFEAKLYFAMPDRWRVRVLKSKILAPLMEDPLISCVKVVHQITLEMTTLCTELQNLAVKDLLLVPPLEESIAFNDSDGDYASEMSDGE